MTALKTSKIICIGWHKTGTTTLGDALLELGYSVVGARLDLAESLKNGDVETSLQLAENFEALQDVPWAALYKELDQRFPNSKFILTVRDEEKWLTSASKHFGGDFSPMREWLYGVGVLKGNENIFVQRYRKHYDDVHHYFKDRPEDLLVMDLGAGDGWQKLCRFLNKPLPVKAFPHSNKGKHNFTWKEKIVDSIRNATPLFIRKWRITLLDVLGLSGNKDRFNNKVQNRTIMDQTKKS